MTRKALLLVPSVFVLNVRLSWVLALIGSVLGLSGSSLGIGPSVLVGAVFSSAQQTSQSFLRFYNTGSDEGTVTVTLRDYATGQSLAEWTSPSISSGAEEQYPITTIESGAGETLAKPSYYSISIASDFPGYFQHVLWRSANGTLTNLSTCGNGAAASSDKLSGVHSSLLSSGFPSSIVVSNTSAAPMSAALGIYDARDGAKLATYNVGSVAPNAQAILTVNSIEAAVGLTPSAGMYHYVVMAEGSFVGFLQHLVNNVQGGIVTDMTAACSLDGSSSVAGQSSTRAGTIFSTAQSSSQSFLRFYNTGETSGAATVTLNDYADGQELGQWISPSILAGAERQFSISTVENETGQSFSRPDYYSITIESDITGYFQHVLWRSADGTLTNLSTCSGGVAADSTGLSGVHSSLLGASYPSTVVVNNTGPSAATVALGIYDARDGTKLGTYTTELIPAGGAAIVAVSTVEETVGAPASEMYHYVFRVEGEFTGFLQHLVNNVQVGVVTDMTTACSLEARPAARTYVSYATNPRFGAPCESGETTLDGYLLVCSNAGVFRYALHCPSSYKLEQSPA